MKKLLMGWILLSAMFTLNAYASESQPQWGQDITVFLNKTSNGYGQMIEAIPKEGGQKMTFLHYDVTPEAVIFRFKTQGERLKRSPLAWAFRDSFRYTHQKDDSGRTVSMASFDHETNSLIINEVNSKGKIRSSFAYEQIDLGTLATRGAYALLQ